MGENTLTLYAHMLGGGLNQYYRDGGVTLYLQNPKPDCDADRSFGTGAPATRSMRYGETFQKLYTDTVDQSASVALKNVVSADDAAAAMAIAEKEGVVITGNHASRGGGIGTNGNLIIGTPAEKAYSVTVEKKWENTPEDEQAEVSVYLLINGEELGPVKLNKTNDWTATFSGLTDDPTSKKPWPLSSTRRSRPEKSAA